MKKILILIVSLFLIGNVMALCEKVDMNKAIESYTVTKQVQVMENRIITIKTIDKVKTEAVFIPYRQALAIYNNLTDKSKAIAPIKPSVTYKNITVTKSVPKVETKIVYYINWKELKVESKTITKPVFETKTITEYKIKSGYKFNETNGEFYRC